MSFHTPKRPDPLKLDLAALAGGGSCPAQFEGQTHEGQDVYVRYRGGGLTVDIAKKKGMSVFDDARRVLDADIGPPYDGSMSLAQFCEIFGVTVNGSLPEESDPTASTNTDLTGETTYWNHALIAVTIQTSREILQKCHASLPGALLVQPIFNEEYQLERLVSVQPLTIEASSVFLVDGASQITEIPTSQSFVIMPKLGQLQISIRYSAWKYPRPKYGMVGENHISRDLGRPVFEAGYKNVPDDIAITTDRLSMSASFPTADSASYTKLLRLETLIDGFFEETQLEKIDLVGGERLGEWTKPIDQALATWCQNGPNRFLAVSKDDREGPWLGIRPKHK